MTATVHHHPPSWTAHVLPAERGGGGRIEVYRSGTFAGCAYWNADGTIRAHAPKLEPVLGWLRGLVPR